MKIIILAQENDNHTAPIKWALENAGYQVACWGGLSWNEMQQASLLLSDETKVTLGLHTVEPGDVVWIRRPDPPVHNPKVSESDRKFAELEYRCFYHSIAYILETLPVWCVNKYSAARFINNKAIQLHIARSCGLNVPVALMSNAPSRVRNFFAQKTNRTICKAFTPHVWTRESGLGVAVTETFELTREMLPPDEVLTYAPGIYQDMVVKQFDVRTVLMGNRVYSYALHNPLKALDWRQDAGQGKIEVRVIATPSDVEQGIQAFAQKSGICFGSLDFAVDANDQWWFLEVNEQGQFLWLDQFDLNIKMQEKFCAFITAPKGSTQSLEEREGLFPSFAEYEKFVEKLESPPVPAAAPGSPYLSIEA